MRLLAAIIVTLLATPVAAQAPSPLAANAVEPAPTPAAPATAAAARATVLHVPVAEAIPHRPIEIIATIDGAWAEPMLVVRWRARGTGAWRDTPFEQSSAGGWYAILPPAASVPPGAEYYIVGTGGPGREVPHFASAAAPQAIRIEPGLVDRLELLDDGRTGGRTESVSFDVDGHDFGNRYGEQDRFARAELRWSHRVSRKLHAVSFGFVSIWGKTPDTVGPFAGTATTLARYGNAAVSLRPHPSVFVDARLALGVSHEGFLKGVGGTVTFGKPWRANLSMGADLLDDLGPTAFVRLQWDTAVPLIMGASVVRTDLPGAVVEADGLYVKYDVAWALRPAFTARAAFSYGARDGAGRFGGGLGVQTDF